MCERALPSRERAQLLQHRLPAWPHQRHEPARLTIQSLLVAGQAGELLHRFREPAPRLRSPHLTAAAREGERRGVERVHRLLRQRRRFAAVRIALLQLLARRGHLTLGEAQRPLELR